VPNTRSRVVQPPVLDAARSQAAVRELWLALYLPRFMLEALTQADSPFADA
jgi:hypothetical protein